MGAGISGIVAAVVALLLGYPLAVVGLALGIGVGLLGLRDLARQVTRTSEDAVPSIKEARRQLGARTLLRLLAISAIAIAAFFLSVSLGVGTVAGLVLYQFAFVVGAVRLVASQGGLK